MAQRKRRGFTIVELVIVIAVIAILAGVLIPTFISVINKANVASDTSLVYNINEALVAEEATEGKPATMYEALQRAEANGFNIEKLTPRSSGDIVWDSTTNRFALVDKDGETVYSFNDKKIAKDATVWKIVASAADATGNKMYSSYIKGNATIASLEVSTGVDVGQNTVAAVSYKGGTTAKEVTIRTDGGSLNVDAELDTINHHGEAKDVTIVKCAMSSYHVYAKITGTVTLQKGNVEIENTGSVSIINITATNASDFAVSNSKGGSLDVVTASDPTVISADGENKNVSVTDKTGVMTSEDVEAVAYSEAKGFLKEWENKPLGNGKTVLLKDLEGEGKVYHLSVNDGTEATFDLNGHKFKTDNSYNMVDGKLTFMDSSSDESGLYYCNVDYTDVQSKGILRARGKNAVLTIQSGHIEARDAKGEFNYNNGPFGLTIEDGATIIVNGGTVKATWYAIAGSGQDVANVSTIIVNGGNLISVCDYAIYLPHNGVTTINGGVVDGAAGAVCFMRGTLTINGGKFTSDGTGNVGDWGDGTAAVGTKSLITVTRKYGACTLLINGGEYKVAESIPILVLDLVNNTYTWSITISAGTYNKNVDNWIKSPYECVDNKDGTWTVQQAK